jgi:hypothetical protein
LSSVTLYYKGKGATWLPLALADDGLHGDGAAGDHVFGTSIPGDTSGTVVSYYVKATDTNGLITYNPTGAPSIVYSYTIGTAVPHLVINEIMADNTHTIADGMSEYDDWIEIYNADTRSFDLSGMYLSDDPALPAMWKFPVGSTLAAGARLLVWCDDDPDQGPYHTNFKLSAAGDFVGLYDVDATGRAALDAHTFAAQAPDWSEGRWPDGSSNWVAFYNATPNASNQEPDAPPVITLTTRSPSVPTQLDTVTVTSHINDDHTLAGAALYVDIGTGFLANTMYDDGQHGDGAAGDHVFGARISPRPLGSVVKYYIRAQDNTGKIALDPATAPTDYGSYEIGYQVPPILINEFLADNAGTIADEYGEYDDWIELYNAGSSPIDLGGMYLTDTLATPAKWQIPSPMVLAAHEYLLFWADSTTSQGPMHTSFGLSKSGEAVGLYDTDANGHQRIDTYTFGSQTTNRSTGRSSDGAASWQVFTSPTPTGPNSGIDPVQGVAAHPYNTVVDTSWQPHGNVRVTGYDVFGSNAAGGPYARLTPSPVSGRLPFRDMNLVNGQARFYKVRARLSDGSRSRDSAPASATPLAGATTPVTDLTLRVVGGNVVLQWSQPTCSPALTRVDVFRDNIPLVDGDVDAGLHLLGTAPVAGPFTDTGEATATQKKRFYQVRPVDTNGQRATE